MSWATCPRCNSLNTKKNGFNLTAAGEKKQRYQCLDCDRKFQLERNFHNKAAKVLVFDIETLPIVGYFWSLKMRGYLSPKNIIKETCVLSWAAKWLNDTEIMSDILTPEEALERNDERILMGIWDLFEEAEIVIAHNGDRFDISKLNGRWWKYDINPPTPYQSVDTLKQSFRNFGKCIG